MSQIPLKTVVNVSQMFPDFFLAKSGIKFSNNSEKSRLVSGFGFSKNKDQAINSSQFEVLEHFYATYAFNENYINKNNFFKGINLTSNAHKAFLPSEVVLGPVPAEIKKNADANGLGCHSSYEQAVEHAILEIIERHLLAQIWYGPRLVVEMVEARTAISHFRVRLFTPSAPFVPMALAIIDDLEEGIWALGSAARLSMEGAIEHAIQEAMMLIESSSIEKGISYSEEIERRILSLRSRELSKLREGFFETKIKQRESALLSLHMQLDEIIHLSLGDSNEIWVVNFLKSATLNVVRVLSPMAQNPRWLRKGNVAVPDDPFC